MNMDNYPHVTIAADGSLCSTGQHRLGFSRVLYDALRHLGYDRDAPVYCDRVSMSVTPRVSKPHDYANHMFMRL
jgi:hypothetical protein